MVKIYYRNIKGHKLEAIESFRVGSWVHAEAPTDEDITFLVETLGLDADLLRDAVDPYEVPRMEIERKVIYIFSRFPYSEGDHILTAPLLVAIGVDFFATVSQRPFPSILERFLNGIVEFYTTQKTKLFLQLFSQINLAYYFFVNDISRKIRSMSVQLERIENRDIVQFVAFEEVLSDFLSSLVPTNAVLQNLLSGKFLKLYENDKDLVEDLLLQNGQLIELSRASMKSIANIRNAYSTILTNNLNRVIKRLTALTIILTIPTMVASLYGMNVRLPYESSPVAFWGVVGFIIIVVGVLFAVFAKNKWL